MCVRGMRYLVVLLFAAWCASSVQADEHWHADAFLLSRYVYQGVEVVPDESALDFGFRGQWQRVVVRGSLVSVPGASYDKSRIGAGLDYSFADYRLAPVETEFGVRRTGVSRDGDSSDAWELFGLLEWKLQAGLLFDMDAYWEVDGENNGFVLAGFSRPFAFGSYTPSTITPAVHLGLDAGAVSGHGGLRDNHLELSLDASFQASRYLVLTGGISHSSGLSAVDEVVPDGGNETWGRLGVTLRF